MNTAALHREKAGRARCPQHAARVVGQPQSRRTEDSAPYRLRLAVRGAVQGVGFRPFVYRLAQELRLAGFISNSSSGVLIEVEGRRDPVNQFLFRLETEKPPRSFIQSLEATWLDAIGLGHFEIRASESTPTKSALVLPDIATCPECVREVFDPTNRRFRYPFTNCSHCGPRFSIIEALPYDRANTSMREFEMCPECEAEYRDPNNRRFHAQPNACPTCGPHLELWNSAGVALALHDDALRAAAEAVRTGQIVAVKGIGGFHLFADASSDAAVQRLRRLKHREEKPFAVMFPTFASVRNGCHISNLEERLLRSPEAPIVLLGKKAWRIISKAVAPANPNLGVVLPYSPLHHLLMAELHAPVVSTSGNISDEPICTDEREAIDRLRGVADLFLVHNRRIVRHVDDSVVRVMLDRELVLRRARGFAPLPIRMRVAGSGARRVLAVGAHLKNSVAFSVGPNVFVSQHIGDLETEQSFAAFRQVSSDLPNLYEHTPECIAADAHPDYHSTKFAREQFKPVLMVQHHHAHVLSCMAENELEPPVLGVAWDGTGLGNDNTIWGGEFLLINGGGFERVACLRPFRLPGGDAAAREPRRAALGLLHELAAERWPEGDSLPSTMAFRSSELANLRRMLARGINAPFTSSAGRFFDAVASLIGLRQQSRFEGQAAMEVEFAAGKCESNESYRFALRRAQPQDGVRWFIDWGPLIQGLFFDLRNGLSPAQLARKFHNALTEMIVEIAQQIGEPAVALSGGCFQNRILTEKTVTRLREAGFRPYWHQRIPPNDGGISLGQVVAALRQTSR